MKKSLFLLAAFLLTLLSCGGLRPAPDPGPTSGPVPVNPADGDLGAIQGGGADAGARVIEEGQSGGASMNADGGAVVDPGTPPDDFNGPFAPPLIPPTRFQEPIRRATTPAPKLPRARNDCSIAVEVRGYDGLDGCGILLETDNGALLMAGTVPRGEPLEIGTRISIGFEYMRDFTGEVCPNADAVIRVLCMRLLRVSSGLPRPVVCEAYDAPPEWLYTFAKDYAATYVTRFPWKDDRYVYLIETPDGQYMYDCRGYLICKPRKNCLSFIDNFSDGKIIFEG